jgi:hypothetical protein
MLIPLATPAMFRTMDMAQVYDAGDNSLQAPNFRCHLLIDASSVCSSGASGLPRNLAHRPQGTPFRPVHAACGAQSRGHPEERREASSSTLPTEVKEPSTSSFAAPGELLPIPCGPGPPSLPARQRRSGVPFRYFATDGLRRSRSHKALPQSL